jgi:signal transduction histidine kinase/ActR/RegA family two-component response regulator
LNTIQPWDILRAVLDYAGDGIAVAFGPGGAQYLASRRAFEMFGYPAPAQGEAAQQRLDDLALLRPDGRTEVPAAARPVRRALSGATVRDEDMYVRHRLGHLVPIVIDAGPLHDSEGNVAGAIVTWRDVAHHRQLESERLALLERAKRAASDRDNATRDKEEFVSIASHELRTSLNAIVGWAQVLNLKKEINRAELQRPLEAILANTETQAQQIEQLLDLSSIRGGRFSLDVAPVDFADTVSRAVDGVRPAASRKDIEIVWERPESLVISGDDRRLYEVVWNLLSSVIRVAEPATGIGIEVRASSEGAVLTVESPDNRVRAALDPFFFDWFGAVGQRGRTRAVGSQVGAAVARHIIDAHGGTLTPVGGPPGEESAFALVLPLITDASLPPISHAAAELSHEDEIPLTGLRVLLVDDDEDALTIASMALEEAGAEVMIASSGEEALEIYRTDTFDVIVSDLGMPGMDGIDLIKRVRALPTPEMRDTPAVLLTAFARGKDWDESWRAGFTAILSKPFSRAGLVKTVAAATIAAGQRDVS